MARSLHWSWLLLGMEKQRAAFEMESYALATAMTPIPAPQTPLERVAIPKQPHDSGCRVSNQIFDRHQWNVRGVCKRCNAKAPALPYPHGSR